MPSTLPRVMEEAVDRAVPDRVQPGDGTADDGAQRADDQGDEHRDDADDQGPDELGTEHLAAVRDQGEGRETAALAPLAGHREDADDRQDHRHRRPDRGGEVVERQVGVGSEDDERGRRQHTHDDDARHQPEAGAGVEHLAQFHAHEAGEGNR